MAKCDWWEKCGVKEGKDFFPCPNNVDENCNQRPNLVKVKAWVNRYYEDLALVTDVIVGKRPHKSFFPCTILIDRKYLGKGIKI